MVAGLVGSSSVAKADAFADLLQTYSNYEYDQGCTSDCVKEINSLQPLLNSDDLALDASSKLIVVLVEPRLLDPTQGTPAGASDLLNRLRRFKADLVAEGYVPRFALADVYGGSKHQDGKTLLAMRRFLRALKMSSVNPPQPAPYPAMQGAILVGNFPEAYLGQRVGVYANEKGVQSYTFQANPLAHRSEIVLSDLDGGWEAIYQEGMMDLPSLRGTIEPLAAPPKVGDILTFAEAPLTTHEGEPAQLEDFFYIVDTAIQTVSEQPKYAIRITNDFIDPEKGPTDEGYINRIAYPEIFVSRINARRVAVNPNPQYAGIDRPFLDANGVPQGVQASEPISINQFEFPFAPDFDLERRILLDYFDRNHRYRVGGYKTNVPYACIGGVGLGAVDLCGQLEPAGLGTPGVIKPNASLVEYVDWLANPATSTTLRGIDAHASGYSHGFGGVYTNADLAAAMGLNPWRWIESSPGSLTYVPSMDNLQRLVDGEWEADADQYFYRTLWENKLMANASPALYIDVGCEANSPIYSEFYNYTSSWYGRRQHAENLLFFANGVALTARARIFSDWPLDIGAAMVPEKANFGAGMLAYHNKERTQKLEKGYDLAHRKRAYFWSEIGDWTVRKSYGNGIGLMGVSAATPGDLKPEADTVAANKAWLGGTAANLGLDYDLADATVRAVADFDNDGRNEFLLESSGSLGLVDRQGERASLSQHFAVVAGAASGSAFGTWTYNRTTDVIAGTGDYDNDGRQEFLVVNAAGLGILKYDGSRITSVKTASNGTSLGGWILNTNDNNFYTLNRSNGRSKRILATSSWGMGVIELSGTSFVGVASAQNGTKWGNWTVSTSGDVVQGIGDFDGDGADDILIKSGTHLGILSLGTSKTSLMVQPSGTRFGAWPYDGAKDVIRKVADMDTDPQHTADILINNSGSVGILSYRNGTLESKMVQPQGAMFGSWQSSVTDTIEGTGDFTGDGIIDILVSNRRMKRVGVLTLANGSLESKVMQYLDGSLLGNWVQVPCMDIVGTGVFTEDNTAKYLVQPRAGDACATLADAWTQGTVISTFQSYPRDFNIFVQGRISGFQHVQGPVGGGAVDATSFSLNWGQQQPAAVLSQALTLSQGTVTGDIHCTGTPCSYTNVTLKGNAIGNPAMDYAPIFAKLRGMSSALSRLPANGKVWRQNNGLTLVGADPNLNVFALDASAFQNTYSIALKVPATSTVIINVGGTAVAINYAGMNVNGLSPSRILWNLYQATSYENKGMSFSGSVLAPLATATIQWGNMSGTVVAAAATVQSEMYFYPFKNNWLVP
jgi:choice-of-anchor A domain-containing protein